MRITVLIVDDHPSFRAVARVVLADGGYAVVGEPADALAVAEAPAPNRDAPPVVLTSGRDWPDLEPLIRASAARGFIAKEELSPAALAEFRR